MNGTIDSREKGLATKSIDTNQQIHSMLHYNNRKSVTVFWILRRFAMAEVLAGGSACVRV